MNLENPPEIADGGYWYVLDVEPDPDQGGQTPGDVPGQGWCAWYGLGKVVIRCPEIISGLPSAPSETVTQVLVAVGYISKPYGRVGGN